MRKKKRELTINSPEVSIILGIIFLIIGIALAVSPFVNDATITKYFTSIFGVSSIFWGLSIIYFSGRFFIDKEYFKSFKVLLGFLLGAASTSIFFSYWIPKNQIDVISDLSKYGGLVGKALHIQVQSTVGSLLEIVIILFTFVIAFSLVTRTQLDKITNGIVNFIDRIKDKIEERKERKALNKTGEMIIDDSINDKSDLKEYIGNEEDTELESIDTSEYKNDSHIAEKPNTNKEQSNLFNEEQESNKNAESTFEPKYPNWEFPSLELLSDPIVQPQDKEIHKRNAVIIEKTLRSFDIESKVNKITIGPTIVQYALSITIGTKVAKVKNLTNDLALALATSESQIRIEAPIPGTSLIGIEIPNPTPNFVYIKDLINELKQNYSDLPLPLVLGKNVAGKSFVKDLSKLPHLLVAGATGTGKSVGINSIITGLIMTKTPDELRLILVDPKMVELAPYNGLPHLIVPVITDMELVVNALQWAVDEMKTRYRILKQSGTKNIIEYNKKCPESKLPYVVIIVDEMADLMLTTGVDVESRVVRLTQMARAIGIHMILATQRPDVNIITGIIKANVPGRMAFSVSSQIDSRVVIDQTGAETLIGNGDMLFKSPDMNKPLRIQGAFTSTQDTEKLTEYLKQSAPPDYYSQVTKPEPRITSSGVADFRGLSEDPLFEDALEIILNTRKGSASMLQRRLKIGYNRAARLIEEFEDLGVVGTQDGSNPRDVLISSKEDLIRKFKGSNGEDDKSEIYDDE